ncbi:MAG: DPP IV N-terminal domain-containing protein [Planctomycetes bacterium]|nr:DPP IV N-terminal domain-containing protein [Planctomycetota bacterium]
MNPLRSLKMFGVLCLAALLSSLAAASGPWGSGSGKFKDLPNAEKVTELQGVLSEMSRGGRIHDLTWTPSALTFHRGNGFYSVDLTTGVITSIPTPEIEAPAAAGPKRAGDPPAGRARQRTQATSPDGTLKAVHRDGGVFLETIETKEQKPVIEMKSGENIRYGTADWVYGEELDQGDAMWWSPDGKYLAFYAFDDSQVPKYELLHGWDDLRTSKATMWYPKAGDPNPVAGLMVYELSSGRMATIDVGSDREQYVYGIRWTPGGKLLYFRTNRHQDQLDLVCADPVTGKSQVVVTESQPTWQDNRPPMKFLADGDRFIWGSEKSGFRNLELRKISDPSFMQPLTRHACPVLDILDIDEAAGEVWYRANSAPVPMLAQIHRVKFDGTGEQQVTDGLSHYSGMQRSPDGKFFTAVAETPTVPPRSVLLEIDAHGPAAEKATLAASDTGAFAKNNLRPSELFTFTAPDGKTPIWGELFFPPNFDPAKKYPLLIDVYGGPSSQAITGRFDAGSANRAFGLLIAKIDNRGTGGRGKAFETATYLKLCGPDLDDQAAGVKSLSIRPYVDSSRVAIMGHSYGGTMSAMGVLRYPDVFKAAVAGAPVTDWRNYDSIYTERYMRTPKENPEGYDSSSAVKLCATLKARLLLIHGMVDDNVHPSNTLQMAKIMQDAEVPFEMMIFPDSDHGIRSPAYKAKAWWFLAEQLGLLDAPEQKSSATPSYQSMIESISVPMPNSAPASIKNAVPAGSAPGSGK